jgi:hypothetical protein
MVRGVIAKGITTDRLDDRRRCLGARPVKRCEAEPSDTDEEGADQQRDEGHTMSGKTTHGSFLYYYKTFLAAHNQGRVQMSSWRDASFEHDHVLTRRSEHHREGIPKMDLQGERDQV